MPQIDKIDALKSSLAKAWSAATSYDPDRWTADNPSYGQCAVTACVVQDVLGGDIVGADVSLPDGSSDLHFFNVIDGQSHDLTRDQFPAGSVVKSPRAFTENHATTRDYILSYESTRKRYAALCAALNFEPGK